MVSNVHAAFGFTEEFAELVTLLTALLTALLATLLRDELATTLDEVTLTLEATLEREETELEEGGMLDATELLELVGVVPQPIGWVERTISSIQTSALWPLKLWKPNMA